MNQPASASSKFISPAWIHTHPRRDFHLFEVGSGAPDEYKAGHIPGSVYLNTNALECLPLWNRIPDKELESALLAHGITYDKTVVVYARGSTAAARVAVILLYAGVQDVRLLDGGYNAWAMAGFPIEIGENLPVPAGAFGIGLPRARKSLQG